MVAFQSHQVKYYRKYPPRKGLAVTALVVDSPDRRNGASGRLFSPGGPVGRLEGRRRQQVPGHHPGVLAEAGGCGAGAPGGAGSARAKWTGEMIAAPMVQAALVSMEFKTGQVRVLMGGKDFGDSTFNRATQARRQPGSAFKPILYAAAVEKGFRPDSILVDSPLSLPGGRHGQLWSPQNYDHRFYGPIPLAYALAHSRNVPAVRLMMAIGVPATMQDGQDPGNRQPHLSQLCVRPGSFRCHLDGADPGLLHLPQ